MQQGSKKGGNKEVIVLLLMTLLRLPINVFDSGQVGQVSKLEGFQMQATHD